MNTILKNGRIYTVESEQWDQKPAEAIAFCEDGKILEVGSFTDFSESTLKGSRVVDLQGKTVLPGFIDSHVHAPGTAFMDMFEVNLSKSFTKEDIIKEIKEFVVSHPDFKAYFGGGFDISISDEDGQVPCAAWLDEISPDKPITLTDSSMHSRWLNTKSMEMSGIDSNTKIEGFGYIHRFEDGTPTGIFSDCKGLPIMEPSYDIKQQLEAICVFMVKMNSWGYTSIMSIAPIMHFEVERYLDLEKAEKLSLRINCAQMVLPKDSRECVENLINLRNKFHGSYIKISTGKFLVDGVVEGKTALLKEPYAESAGMGKEYYGDVSWDTDALKDTIYQVNRAGFQCHMHCIGDAATSIAVDAIEYSQEENQRKSYRNVITHLQVVDPVDYKRMNQQKIIAAIQPFWHFKEPGWFEKIETTVLGTERAECEYPAKSFVDAGVVITASGDYPVSPLNNPFHGIQAGATRNIYNDEFDIPIGNPDDPQFLLNKDERLTVPQLVEAYTINGAYALFREDEIGSLKVGKRADLIIIDKDIIQCDVSEIHNTKILATVFDGRVVYGEY